MSPDPNWVPCQGVSDLDKAWAQDQRGVKSWNPVLLSSRHVHSLASAIVPRPIALVSTLSTNGRPCLLLSSLSLGVRSTKSKESRANVMATETFTVSLVSEPFVEAANMTSVDAPEHVDMWALSGLTMARSSVVRPGWVKESAVGLECKLYHAVDIPDPDQAL